MLPFGNMKKTIQLGLRIDEELLEKIEKLSDFEGIDKMSWIRRALASFVDDVEDEMEDRAIKDYLNLRIDEKELKSLTGMKEISKDLQEARKDILNKIKEEIREK